jgi:antitoxin component of RelBE/YafQ-DinJ toxin-antitoxin module
MKKIINIKADEEVRDQAKALAAELGVPLSTVVNAYLKEFIRNREVNFSAIPSMTSALEGIIGRAEEDLAARRNVSGPFTSAEAAIARLHAARK